MQVITAQSLVNKISHYDPGCDPELLKFACAFSKQAHGSQKRASGDPYFHHPLEVADILADFHLDSASVITALLHDTVEDTDVTLEEVKQHFGAEVMALVDGVTKLAKIEFQTEHTRQAENFRKLLVAMSEDIRVLMVKLADRLHNMRTLHFIKSPEKRKRIAHETLEIYAPLAERIGIQQIKNELQNLAFAELYPDIHESILGRLQYLRESGFMMVDEIVSELNALFKKELPGAKIEVSGREKTPFSIWHKMERKNVGFEQLSDILAFRVIAEDRDTCYRALGVVHSTYHMVPERFKDFISTKKANGYQSLHTVVIGPDRRMIEVQIRTQEMHQIAELGVAAHWSYKQDHDYGMDGKQYKWIRELLYILEHTVDPEEFLENTKLEMYYDQVFCFTPKGKLIALPKGATSVDFAYEVHSSVGDHCTGAKINGRIVPLRTKLRNGDQVEIITSKTQVPSETWEKFVVTGKAKSSIRRFVRAQKRTEYVKLGRAILDKALKENRLQMSKEPFERALQAIGKKKPDDFYQALGEGSVTMTDFLRLAFPDKKIGPKKRSRLKILKDRKKGEAEGLRINGMIPEVAVSYADCCSPIPGDKVVGVVTMGKGIAVHTVDCQVLESFASTPERLVSVSWGKESGEFSYNARVKVVIINVLGALASVTQNTANEGANITNLRVTDRSEDFFDITIDLAVRGARHLDTVIQAMKRNKHVYSVKRLKKEK